MAIKTVYCDNCGEEYPLSLSMCPHCGAKNPTVPCPHCGNAIDAKAKICPYCDEKKPIIPEDYDRRNFFKWITATVAIVICVSLTSIGLKSFVPKIKAKDTVTTSAPTTSYVADAKAPASNSSESAEKQNGTTAATTLSTTTTKEFVITAGIYSSGIDIPVGVCNVIAISGTGNLISSNSTSGGCNLMFGIDDGSGSYSKSFTGLNLSNNVTLEATGNLKIKLTYTDIARVASGRKYNTSSAVELKAGTYTAGKDFPVGVYKIVAKSGSGNISSSNQYDGGLNESFGVSISTPSIYSTSFANAEMPEGTSLTIDGTLVVTMTPTVN